jgi:hypothetical protein
LATFSAFQTDPKSVWEWYEYRKELIARYQPNAARRMLAFLEQHDKNVFLVTQSLQHNGTDTPASCVHRTLAPAANLAALPTGTRQD